MSPALTCRLLLAALTSASVALSACGSGGAGDTACGNRKAGDLVITEFLADPPGTDTGKEYVEIYNATGAAIELKGMTLFVSKADGASQKTHLIQSGTVAPGAYFTLGDVREPELPAHIGYSYEATLGALANSEGIIGIKCGAVELDQVTYTDAAKAGHSRSYDGDSLPDSTGNNDELLFCDATTAIKELPGAFGTPGTPNDACNPDVMQQTCIDSRGPRPVALPLPGDLLFTEVMADPAVVSDANGEWVEIYAKEDVDLNGVTLIVNSATEELTSGECLHIPAGTYATLARVSDAAINGGLGTVLATHGLNLPNSGGTLALRLGATTIDSTAYKTATSGVSAQLDSAKLDAAMNDEGANFCPSTGTYGTNGNKGTPGAANRSCAPPATGEQCIDATTGTARNIRMPEVGDLVISEFMANPKAVADTAGEWIEVWVKRDLDLNGVQLANEGTGNATLSGNTCIQAGAGSYALFARGRDSALNGGLPDNVTAVFDFDLFNSSNATGPRAIKVRRDGGVLDEITYTSSGDGISSQLDSAQLDPVNNNDAGAFCPAKPNRVYAPGAPDGGDRGTPGAANDPCP